MAGSPFLSKAWAAVGGGLGRTGGADGGSDTRRTYYPPRTPLAARASCATRRKDSRPEGEGGGRGGGRGGGGGGGGEGGGGGARGRE